MIERYCGIPLKDGSEGGVSPPVRRPEVRARAGETPQSYLNRLTSEVYTSKLQRAILQAHSIGLQVSMVGRAHVKDHSNLPLEPASELFVPKSLEEAHRRYVDVAETMDEEQRDTDFCFGAQVKLQLEFATEAIRTFNTLGYESKQDFRKFEARTKRNSLDEDLSPFQIFILKLIPKEVRNKLLFPVFRREFNQSTWSMMLRDLAETPSRKARDISQEGLVTLGDFEFIAFQIAALGFLKHNIETTVHSELERLIDDYYQLGELGSREMDF